LVVAGAYQQAVEAKGLGAGKGKLTATQQTVVDPAKAVWKGFAESAGNDGAFYHGDGACDGFLGRASGRQAIWVAG
jgi:hypothetical protein